METVAEQPVSLIRSQRRILYLCWMTYVVAYLLRMNFSVAVPLLKVTEGYTNTEMGILNGLFFLTYTSGQLLNGLIGDHLRSKVLLVTGLSLSAVCNIGCALSGSLPALTVFWAVNGFAQSMLWGPIVRTLALWYEPKALNKISFYMALSTIAGYALSWALASILGESLGWRAVFFIPSIPVILFAVLLLLAFRSAPPSSMRRPELPVEESSQDEAPPERTPLGYYLLYIRMPLLFLMAAALGVVREGISAWLPTSLADSGILPDGSIWQMLLVIPLINLLGVLLVRQVMRRTGNDSSRTLLRIFPVFVGLALILAVLGGINAWVTMLLTILLLSMTYGSSPIFTSLIPFQLASHGRVSLTAGLLDFSIYCGAALSSAVSGALLDRYSWSIVYLFWLGSASVGLLAMLLWVMMNKKGRSRE